MPDHQDFTYVPEPTPSTPTRGLGTGSQKSANDLAYRAASAAYRIRSTEPDAKLWRPLLDALPDDIRELTRTYLVQFHTAQKDKARRVAARDSTTAAEEMAKMKEIMQ